MRSQEMESVEFESCGVEKGQKGSHPVRLCMTRGCQMVAHSTVLTM